MRRVSGGRNEGGSEGRMKEMKQREEKERGEKPVMSQQVDHTSQHVVGVGNTFWYTVTHTQTHTHPAEVTSLL